MIVAEFGPRLVTIIFLGDWVAPALERRFWFWATRNTPMASPKIRMPSPRRVGILIVVFIGY